MRPFALVLVVMLVGCSDNSPATAPAPPPLTRAASTQPASATAPSVAVRYDPQTFRADVTRLVNAGQYASATALVKAADIDLQLRADGTGYVAVGQDMIVLPGLYPNVAYNRARDWYIPGTQDAIQDVAWKNAATEFARRYNQRRAGKGE